MPYWGLGFNFNPSAFEQLITTFSTHVTSLYTYSNSYSVAIIWFRKTIRKYSVTQALTVKVITNRAESCNVENISRGR